jgi:HAD superfamily hydrolase (TIGR01509 family)
VFEKDGTLLDLDKLWVPVTRFAANRIFETLGIPKSGIEAYIYDLGIRDGSFDISAPFPRGAFSEMIDILIRHARAAGATETDEEIVNASLVFFSKEAKAKAEIAPICDNLREVLLELRDSGIALAVVTADELKSARYCLEALGIADVFDTVLAFDGVHPQKPDPYYMNKFLQEHGFYADEVIMVGDTDNDIRFAKNSGTVSVGVAKTPCNAKYIKDCGADYVIRDVSELAELLARI